MNNNTTNHNNTHNISKEEIVQSAKKIMDDFTKELDKYKDQKEEFGQIRPTNKRELNIKNKVNQDFIDRVFANAPKKKENFIIAEQQKRDL
ncbi:MAG: hypothetical protein WC755_04965 [Candidatus Woesearchaeota archaeon]|jgi:hypothetical protein